MTLEQAIAYALDAFQKCRHPRQRRQRLRNACEAYSLHRSDKIR